MTANQALACECNLTPLQALDGADIVFVGEIAQIDGETHEIMPRTTPVPTFSLRTVDVKVDEVFKGNVKGTVTVIDGFPGLCQWSVFNGAKKGDRYLIYARGDESVDAALSANVFCSRTGLAKKAPDLAVIRPYAKAHPELRTK